MTETISIADFVAREKITATATLVDHNPNMSDDNWHANHYRVTLKRRRKTLTVYYSMGEALTNEPTAEDVLDCLSSDSAGIENARGFDDWCGEYGYSTDSRRAERIFRTCEAQARKLRAFLGDGLYDQLLWHTERL